MKKTLFLFLFLISIISCEKEDDFVTPTTPPDSGQQPTPNPEPDPDPVVIVSDEEFAQTNFGNMVTANFMGRIVDENGLGLENVTITIGNTITTTNYLGIFSINDVSVFDKFAYVKASKEGYILGSRTIVPTPNATNDIQITLLEKNVVGSVNSGETASISLQNGAEVTFSGEFTTETGAPYTGQVDVVMHYLQPNNPETFEQMPGSLFGKREDGSAVGMETYGMLGINLFSPSGESLNINENAPATLTFPVDASTPNAPTQMPLWYFDEEQGYWKEEGIATKVGNEYIAEVTHFSWWNCDLPISNLVTLCFTLDATVTLSNQRFEIIRTANDQIIFSGYTNAVGQDCGLFPKNENLTINIYSDCSNTIIATQQVGPFATDDSFVINLADLPSELVQTTITGTLNDCDGNPITNGYVLIYKENDINFLNVETTTITDGSLNYTIAYCAEDAYEMIVFDATNNEESDPINLNLTTTTTDIGTVSTCEISGGTFVGDVELNSQAEVDNFGLFGYATIDGNFTINGFEGEITSLQSLTSLTTVTGNLVIQNNEALTSLAGLENITTVSGYFYFGDNSLVNMTGLEGLTTVSNDILIKNNAMLTDLTGLTNLTTVSGYFRIEYNPSLSNLVGLDNLTTVSDYFNIEQNPALTSLEGLENLTSLPGDLIIKDNYNLISVNGLNNLTTVSGKLEFQDNYDLESLAGLESLTTVSDALSLYNNGELTNLSGLDNLTNVNKLIISRNLGLLNLTGLENVTSVSDYVSIYQNYALTSLTGLDNLTTVADDFILKDNTALLSLAPLGNLTTVSGVLEINGCTSMPDLTGMVSLTNVGRLNIIRNQLLSDLTGLENIAPNANTILISYNNTLTSLNGLENVTNLTSITILANPALQSLTGLENLTTISSSLQINNNDNLTDLSGLNNLSTITSDLLIYDNYFLASLTGLENLTTVGRDIKIGDNDYNDRPNPSLSDFCALTNLFTNGNYNSNNVIIQNNAYNPTPQAIINGNCSD
ncbi:hypothetical protein U8527_12290 [Kordia algicida OT-1]|uniref:Leucine-rich protein n=1 Tax=Kordia algicida OT-1 TaxID=391587 RepID=A9E0N1_9FLAO|nr:hypothetical protein [Kordia algicida]EDP95902.1 leucine-rich protein [Kordia algicida OT-1]